MLWTYSAVRYELLPAGVAPNRSHAGLSSIVVPEDLELRLSADQNRRIGPPPPQLYTMVKPRAVIADDHPLVRTMVRQLIESCALVVFEACDGLEALEAVEHLQPDLLVLDVSMPKMGGFEVLRSLRARTHRLAVIMISEHNDPTYVREAHSLGARDFLLKRMAARELPGCIQRLFCSAS